MTIGERISLLRRHSGLRQIDLAEKLYVSPKTISKWENGYGLPDIKIVPHLASALGVSADFLLSGNPATERAYSEELSAKGSAADAAEEAKPAGKRKLFSLGFHPVLQHRLTIWILLCNVVLIALSFFAVPIAAKNEAAGGGTLYYSVLSLFYHLLTDGYPDLAARGCASTIYTLWLIAFLPFIILSVIAIVRQAQGRNEGGILLASIQFGIAFLLFLAAGIGSLCVNFTAGEVYLYPGWSFVLVLLAAFLHLLLQALVGMYGKPIRRFQILSIILAALLAACAVGGCIAPHAAVQTEPDPGSIQVAAWDLQAEEADAADGQAYNCVVHSYLTVRANIKIESIESVGLSYRRTAEGGESFADQAYFMMVTGHRETTRRDGAYDNVFSIEIYLTQNEGETLSDFRFSFIVSADPTQQVRIAESAAVL